jgi:hypothetical protein
MENTMKISNETLTILKNYSSICSNLFVKPGGKIRSLAPTKNIMAEAKVAEKFPVEFGIYDLSQFLSTISLFKDPDFVFQEKMVVISSPSKNAKITYRYSDPSLLIIADKDVKMPDVAVEFDFKSEHFNDIMKAASTLQLPNISVESREGSMILRVFDSSNENSTNDYSIVIGDNTTDKEFVLIFKAENFKFLPDDYHVRVSSKNVSEFTGSNRDIKYWVTLVSDSYIR